VALKILPRHLIGDPSFVERFQREARLLARLNHPGIVAVYDFGQAGEFCYLLLEYVDGVTLRQALRNARMTPAQALALVPPICEALQFAHDHGVLHRDIKPENILLDTAGRVKIADFGIAKLVGDPLGDITLTENGARLGTPHYMAPEQIEDPSRVDHRADVYSLGVVFYELLTGELPLGRFAAPSLKSALDARIDDIVLRALAKERELRQQSVGEVKTQVEDVTRWPAPTGTPQPLSQPTAAPPTPLSTRRLNWATGLVAVSLVIALPWALKMGYSSTVS
jgi:serine/threonine protein kinase